MEKFWNFQSLCRNSFNFCGKYLPLEWRRTYISIAYKILLIMIKNVNCTFNPLFIFGFSEFCFYRDKTIFKNMYQITILISLSIFFAIVADFQFLHFQLYFLIVFVLIRNTFKITLYNQVKNFEVINLNKKNLSKWIS